jgi:hypothetical protein
MVERNLRQFSKNFVELQMLIAMGYIDPSIAKSVRKFAQGTLPTNKLTFIGSFENNDPFLSTPQKLFISSTDTDDTVPVIIKGTDENFNNVEEIITLTGQTAIETANTYRAIWRMANANGVDLVGIVSAGTEEIPVGGLPDGENTYCNIPLVFGDSVSANQSLTGVFVVPVGWTGFLVSATMSATKGKDIEAVNFARANNGSFKYLANISVFEATFQQSFNFEKLEEKTDFKPMAFSGTGGIATISYEIMLINNDYLNRYIY